jgi:hypothetical protein
MVAAAQTIDPLLSWNEGTVKQSTINLVTKVTKVGSPDVVPPAERIAVLLLKRFIDPLCWSQITWQG